MSVFTLDAARAITAATTDAAVRAMFTATIIKGDQYSARTAHIVAYRADATSGKAVAEALGVSAPAVSRYRRQVAAWEATGLSDAALSDKRRPWQAVTSADFWLAKWATPEGEALLKAMQAAEGDDAKMALLFGEALPEAERPAPTAKDLISALTRAAALSEAVTLSADDAAVVADLLALIGERAAAPVLVAA